MKYCIWMPFDLQLEPYDKRGWRYAKTGADPKWWIARAQLLRDYVLPSFHQMEDQDFEVLVPFVDEEVESGIALPVLKEVRADPKCVPIIAPPMRERRRGWLFGGTRLWAMAERYRDKCDWVAMLWLDSDDCYRSDIWKHVKRVKPRAGQALGFKSGYCFHIKRRHLFRWRAGQGRGSAPFFGYFWPNSALASYRHMKAYAKRHNFCCVHTLLGEARHVKWMPDKLYCSTMSGSNCTKDFACRRNKALRSHLAGRIDDPRRKWRILRDYGIKKVPDAAPLVVQSMPRSGTHFLLACLVENFDLGGDYGGITGSGRFPNAIYLIDGKEHKLPKGRHVMTPYMGLWGNHNLCGSSGFDPDRMLYILRHPVWKYLSELRFYDPDANGSWKQRINEGNLERWLRHVKSYEDCRMRVRQEDLAGDDFAAVMTAIGERFGLTPRKSNFERPPLLGMQPRKRKWTKRPSDPMLAMGAKIVPEGFCGYSFRPETAPCIGGNWTLEQLGIS